MCVLVFQRARQFFLTKGLGSLPQVLVNGLQINLEEEELETAIVTHMHQQTYELQQAVFNVSGSGGLAGACLGGTGCGCVLEVWLSSLDLLLAE